MDAPITTIKPIVEVIHSTRATAKDQAETIIGSTTGTDNLSIKAIIMLEADIERQHN